MGASRKANRTVDKKECRRICARQSEATSMRSFLHTAICNETTTILDYLWEKAAPGDLYAQDVRPRDVTVTPPSGWERSFLTSAHVLLGNVQEAANVVQDEEHWERVSSKKETKDSARIKGKREKGERKSKKKEGEEEREKGNIRRRHPIDKQINRGWKDDPQSYRSTWLHFSFALSLSLVFASSFGFPTCAFTRSLAGRGKRESALPLSNLSPAQKNWPTSSWVIYKKRKLLYNEERPLSKENIIFRMRRCVSFMCLGVNRERRNNIYIDALTLSLI